MEQETISAGEIILRPFAEEDIPWVYAVSLDPAVQRYLEIPLPYRVEHAEHFVREMAIAAWGRRERVEFVVEQVRDGTRLGRVGLGLDEFVGIDHDRLGGPGLDRPGGPDHDLLGGARIGYWMDPAARGRGVATAAVRALCGWAFGALRLGLIEWRAEVGNVASRRVAEKAGFRFEAVLRRRLVHRGQRVDAWIGSMVPEEMPTRPGSSVQS
ncbi:GNAT family N-acetyltransferase [Actinoplanes sp. TBRC 11911]|uniref:GNAT family N-acetyltransferase n=1 Tax=Actinoplanes sp. TBRC 11911 TaxID=2729386 RepID=UPI00145F353C|nr:GNAT family N-acetyltransferase [Actinoplanes sp. TBRC 11911]NMO57215.1 GNAT family N-acetyltransferase [Actinoplanes sp. TBRC 11911]